MMGELGPRLRNWLTQGAVTVGRLVLQSSGQTWAALQVRGAPGQAGGGNTQGIQEWANSAGAIGSYIDASGFVHASRIYSTAGSITAINLSSNACTFGGSGSTIGFYGLSTPIAQPQAAAVTTGYTAGTGTAVTIDGTFTGNVGSTAYTTADLVAALKNLNLIKT